MDISTIFYIALAIIIALGFAFFQYLYKSKNKRRETYVFFTLRFLSVFILLLLLINPKIISTTYELEKPNLILAVDDSESIAHLEQEDTVREILEYLKSSEALKERFELVQYNFGNELLNSIAAQFNAPQTNIYAALESLKDLSRKKSAAIVLISDGNQSTGRDFRYFKTGNNQEIYPLVVGDTTQYLDLELSRLNVNTYAFLNNRFPVEVFISYSGEEEISSEFIIRSGENVIFSKEITLNSENNSTVIQAELPASRLGVLSYEAEIIPLEIEKNTANNTKKFAVEVIDERSKILLISAIPHPDIGTFKKSIETNKQRQLDIKYLQDDLSNLKEYQLVILYQPSSGFASVFEDLEENDQSYLVVSGTQTDWNFLNRIQDFIKKDFANQSQEIFSVKNLNFNQFQFEEVGFSEFPPLEDKFGSIRVQSNSFESIYFQKIENVETSQPLIAIEGKGQNKKAFIFGENIWRWRSASYLEDKSFEKFDNFIGKLVQNIASTKQRERLTIDYKSFYYENEPVKIIANFFDQNYQFDPNANLGISVESSGENLESRLILRNNGYEVDFGNLTPGTYDFKITEAGSQISRSGSFEVIAYNIEQQFISANRNAMEALAASSGTKVYHQDQVQDMINTLLSEDKYKPVQKSRQKIVPLIDWFYLLFMLVFILAAEWFFRKYKGLI
ncbi:VWA domain-containing protein [Salegentibacter sp. JZCK2]|uniref:VWA domain-containing protein n=1 Tax=Salegentibacter tibetensis TaxID=2873600 RepID=UPI001CCFAD0F|nr:VWA domain-containing protein [Salegentibacter tibetensis]MBZ9729231.1 VWA domain-containing protein [Salegentibacter tibetensis]